MFINHLQKPRPLCFPHNFSFVFFREFFFLLLRVFQPCNDSQKASLLFFLHAYCTVFLHVADGRRPFTNRYASTKRMPHFKAVSTLSLPPFSTRQISTLSATVWVCLCLSSSNIRAKPFCLTEKDAEIVQLFYDHIIVRVPQNDCILCIFGTVPCISVLDLSTN